MVQHKGTALSSRENGQGGVTKQVGRVMEKPVGTERADPMEGEIKKNKDT